MKSWRFKAVLTAIAVACTLTLSVACGGGKGPTDSTPVAQVPDEPTASAPAATQPPASTKGTGICEGKETFKSEDGKFEFCVLGSTLELADNRCQIVPENGGSWTYTVGIQKGSGYWMDQIFTSAENNCGATGEGGGAGSYNAATFKEGDTVVFTLEAGPGCGRKQRDIYANVGGVRTWVRAVVFNYPKPCRTCESADLKLDKSTSENGNNTNVTISASWKKAKGDSATIEGDGASGSLSDSGSFPAFSVPRDGKTRTYTVTLTFADGQKCVKTISVTSSTPSCGVREVSLRYSNQQSEASVASSVQASVVGSSGTFTLTWAGSASGSTIDPDIAVDPPAPTNTGATSPATLNHTYAFASTPKSYTAKGVVTFADGAKCEASMTVEVRAYTCRDFAPGGPITGDIGVDTQPTVVNFSVGTVLPAGVTFANEPLPASKPRPDYGQPAGSFSTTGTLAYSPAEGLSCPLEKTFTKPIPPKEATCEQSNPNFGNVNGSGSKTVTESSPATPTFYWYDGENSGIQDDCQAEGGTYFASTNIPGGDSSVDTNVCKTTVNHGSEWEYDHNDEADREYTQQGSAAKYSLSVASSWSVAAGKAQTLTFEIVYIPSNFVKKSKTQEFGCGQSGQGSLTWGPGDEYNSSPNYSAGDGHITGTYKLRVKRGGTTVGEFPLP